MSFLESEIVSFFMVGEFKSILASGQKVFSGAGRNFKMVYKYSSTPETLSLLSSFTNVLSCSYRLLKLVYINTGKCSGAVLDCKFSIEISDKNCFTSSNRKGFGCGLRFVIMGSIISL
jgi:hypothetical protein